MKEKIIWNISDEQKKSEDQTGKNKDEYKNGMEKRKRENTE